MRHQLGALFAQYSGEIIRARKSDRDIGRKAPQGCYSNTQEIVRANFSRVQESLRVLEEYARLAFPNKVAEVKKLRFKSYILEKKIYEKVISPLFAIANKPVGQLKKDGISR